MEYANLGKAPISEEKPAGDDCRYNAEFEALQAEIDKLSVPTTSGKVDWSKVVKTAAGILQQQSKDLTVASYLAVGLINNHQVQGFDQGLSIMQGLVENYWDTLYPPKNRMRGRMGALNWWTQKTGEVLGRTRNAAIPIDLAQRIQGDIKTLSRQLAHLLPQPLSLRPVERALAAIPVKKGSVVAPSAAKAIAAAESAATVKTPAARTAPASSPATAVPATIGSDQDALKRIEKALQQVRQPSLYLLQQDLSNPLAYRYRRMACWSTVTALPPSSDGNTRIPAPPPQLTAELSALLDEGNWPGLIRNCEQKIPQYVFWFDLHFMVARGLKQMGATHRRALDEVCREAVCLLLRLPGIEKLAFADGTPFAVPRTRKWLRSVGFGDGGDGSLQSDGQNGQEALLENQTQQALALARKKRLADAVGLLQEEMQRAPAQRDRMCWRLAIIQVLLAVKKSQLALPHIEQVLSAIDTYHLETWDPQLALKGLSAAWKGFNVHGAHEYQKRCMEMLDRIAAIFPVEALRIGQ